MFQTHLGNCPRYPIGCPNRCDMMKIPREELEIHLKERCKSALTVCPYKDVGCKHKVSYNIFHDNECYVVFCHLTIPIRHYTTDLNELHGGSNTIMHIQKKR